MVVKLDEQSLDNIRSMVIMDVKEKYGHNITEFTCDECESRFTCTYVFDPYNTDGDCLLNK